MKYLIYLIPFLVLLGCEKQSNGDSEKTVDTTSVDSSWENIVAYEIFVQSFYDSNSDSIGDIKGLISKLDYVDDLGVDAIWLMPVMPSPSYHKYDVTDYYDIHPDYGSMEDFKDFIEEAHKRDIKVILDLVVNHTSNQHPWFEQAASEKNSEYRDYYVWADRDSIQEQLSKKETSFDSDNITQWHAVDGKTDEEHYYGFFWGGMPDLNFDNPEVMQEMVKIGKFWLEEVGVDGFRLDAARHIFPDDQQEKNHRFWKNFKEEMQKIKPDVYMIGEIWLNADEAAPYASGFTSFFNFDLAFSIIESIKRGEVVSASIAGHGWKIEEDSSFIARLIENRKTYESYNPDYQDAIFLSNHDQNRVMSVLGNDGEKAKAAASILFTLPGTPYIYYGEEIGMRGMKPDERIREPFYWADEEQGSTRWISVEHNSSDSLQSLAKQKTQESSIYSHYKKLIKLREDLVGLRKGRLIDMPMDNPSILAYKRVSSEDDLVIIHNISNENTNINLAGEGFEVITELNGKTNQTGDGKFELPPYSTLILKSLN